MTKSYDLMLGEMPDFDEIPNKLRRKIMRKAAKAVAVEVRKIVPDSGRAHKGKLKKSIRYEVLKGGDEGRVYSTAPHAHLVHDGVKGGTYTAREGHVMVFYIGSEPHFTKTIHYKSQPGRPFFVETAARMRPELERILTEGADEALAEIAAGPPATQEWDWGHAT
jgi:hypothetical protein